MYCITILLVKLENKISWKWGFLDGYVTDSVIEPFGGKLQRERERGRARPQESGGTFIRRRFGLGALSNESSRLCWNGDIADDIVIAVPESSLFTLLRC